MTQERLLDAFGIILGIATVLVMGGMFAVLFWYSATGCGAPC